MTVAVDLLQTPRAGGAGACLPHPGPHHVQLRAVRRARLSQLRHHPHAAARAPRPPRVRRSLQGRDLQNDGSVLRGSREKT